MPEIISYLVKANFALALFYLGYRLLLRKLTFYNLNRFYLLFAFGFSMSYPLVNISDWFRKQEAVPADVIYFIPDWQEVPVADFSFWPYLLVLFWGAVAFFAIRLGIQLLSLYRIHRQSSPARWKDFNYRQVFLQIIPFSFWRTIYLNVKQHEQAELDDIFEHEFIHVEELHTIDIILSEMLVIFCWFNPASWLLRHAVRENLEFITDRRVLQSGADKKAYQYSLLKIGYSVQSPELAAHFNLKNIKNRIMMMNKRKSSGLHVSKYLIAVPVIAVFLSVFTISRAYQEDDAVGVELLHPSDLVDNIGVADRASLPPEDTVRIAIKRDNGKLDTLVHMVDGKVEGVHVDAKQDSTKKPAVQIRLTGDFSYHGVDKQPLYVVDGVIVAHPDVSDINPDAIESISVLKGGSAVALYGEQGAKGVVLITTKKGTGTKSETLPDSLHSRIRIHGRPLDGQGAVVGTGNGTNETKEANPTVVAQSTSEDGADVIKVIGYGERKTGGLKIISANGKSVNADDMLIMVNGKESSKQDFSDIYNPQHISALAILKGDNATAKYGDKGKNGVIEITVKK